MTVKELITKLLDESMDAEVQLAVTKNGVDQGVSFDIEDIIRWAHRPLLVFEDWRDYLAEEKE